jgi:hypothetical protein
MTLLGIAKANPTKAFFVRMITRDISLGDCILDLIDNSIDGAWELAGSRPMSLSDATDLSKYKIEIEADLDHFRILDNCGGISFDDAAEYAFTFGRDETDPHEQYSIGVYGIGLKRAVFKIGTQIKIRSTYDIEGRNESFGVPIDVPTWVGSGNSVWDFDIEEAEALPAPGVEVVVTGLNEGTAVSFGNPGFIQDLKRIISRDYALHLQRGLSIWVNGMSIRGWQIELLEGGNFSPMRIEYEDGSEKDAVRVEIIAGMAAPPPESVEPDEQDDKESRSGWYVVCNGRIVLAADKSSQSGWGTDDWPKWHPQYEGFLGLIFFASADASLLPLTTTKRSVDGSSSVYRRAMPRMREASKTWISYTNARKQTLEEAKQFESQARPLAISSVAKHEAVSLPRLTAKPAERMANIAYSVTRERVRALASAFGNINMSYRDVGLKSFEYAYADNVEEH